MPNRWENSGKGGRLYFLEEIDGETVETVADFILGDSKSLMVIAPMKLKDTNSLEGKL